MRHRRNSHKVTFQLHVITISPRAKSNQEFAFDPSHTDRIEKSIELSAPIARVWNALTNYREFGQWFRVALQGPFIAGQPAVGHITYPGYEHVQFWAEIVRIEPQHKFAFHWHPYAVDTSVVYSEELPTLVTFTLRPTAQGCHLTVAESGFDKVPAQRRAEAFRMNERGWAAQLENIAHHIATQS